MLPILKLMLAGSMVLAFSAYGGECGACNKAVAATLPNRQEATRFLTQASFGPTQQEVSHLMAIGYAAWLDEQFAAPMDMVPHVAAWDASNKAIMAIDTRSRASTGEVVSSFWRQALTSRDQLRQRIAFALSEIFVISMRNSCGDNAYSRGAADYLDMLGRLSFGKYRDLLESVALHPVMGCYLSHIKNQREDVSTGRVPDENFAREIMQLFSIGLYELNADGSAKLDARNQPIETYSSADISGMAKVFTGWSWWCAGGLTQGCFYSNPNSPNQYVTAMRPYTLYHSVTEKRFLNAVVPASMFVTPEDSLKIALDTLSNHANVGPFLSKQLIQRLVTSNPSPAYVQRVAQAFRASGGNLKVMIKAILLDPQARDMANLSAPTFGKVREPILSMTALMRAMGVHSDSGVYMITDTADPSFSLGQSALSAPTVFNFFRPGFALPNSRSAAQGLVAPELQIATETSVAGYVNAMALFMRAGIGRIGYDNKATRADVQLNANIDPHDPLLALADSPWLLVEEINQRLMYGTMPTATKTDIATTLNALYFGPTPSAERTLYVRRNRLWSALLLTVASPDFQIQR